VTNTTRFQIENNLWAASRPAISALIFFVTAMSMHAQSGVREFVPFQDFQESLTAVNVDAQARSGSKVRSAAAFGEMRQHLLGMYSGVSVKHSFVRDSNHFDCVPVEQQPAVRMLGLDGIATPPPALDGLGQDAAVPPITASDEFGNVTACADRTIPMRRITLEEMTEFPTLRQYLEKSPAAASAPLGPEADAGVTAPEAAVTAHKYAYMSQKVNNLGGHSILNVWSPYVNTALGQIHSLSQQWYVGGSGAAMQTVEVGWQVYPAHYGSQEPRLFIYWTADHYAKSGCYNLDCAAFVQVAQAGILGGGLGQPSTAGGQQYEFSARFYLYQGNWWLAIQGTWIGYYPGKIFNGGQLTKYAEFIQYGTESAAATTFPAEGSGDWGSAGFGKAAYQRYLFHYDTAGTPLWDTLTPQNPSPKCYSTGGPYTSQTPGWQVYFFSGGPGGSGC
jgi:hypothetical protein